MDFYKFFRKPVSNYMSSYEQKGVYGTIDNLNYIVGLSALDLKPISQDNLLEHATYFHEKIHWYQFIGTTSGFLVCSIMPMQFEMGIDLIRTHTSNITSIKKPLIDNIPFDYKLNKLDGSVFMDLEKLALFLAIDTSLQWEMVNLILQNPEFISQFNYYAESQFKENEELKNLKMASRIEELTYTLFNSLCKFLMSIPNANVDLIPNFSEEINKNKLPPSSIEALNLNLGFQHIIEGQARFYKLQHIFMFDKSFNLVVAKNKGYLNYDYSFAFDKYLEWSGLTRPTNPHSFTVFLFLIACEISLMPHVGYPEEIKDYLTFIGDIHPGVRFNKICNAIKNDSFLKAWTLLDIQISPTYDMYLIAVDHICQETKFKSPLDICKTIVSCFEATDTQNSTMSDPFKFLIGRHIDFMRERVKCPENFFWLFNSQLKSSGKSYENLEPPFISDINAEQMSNYRGPQIEKLEKHYLHFYLATQISKDLFRQLLFNRGPFSLNYTWIPKRDLDSGILETGINFFEYTIGRKLSDIKI